MKFTKQTRADTKQTNKTKSFNNSEEDKMVNDN